MKSAKDFLSLLKEGKTADKKAKSVKRSKYVVMQPSSSRRTIRRLSSRSEKANTSSPSKLINPTSSKPSRMDSVKTSKKSKSRREELLLKKPRNDPVYLNSLLLHINSPSSPSPNNNTFLPRLSPFNKSDNYVRNFAKPPVRKRLFGAVRYCFFLIILIL